MEPGCRIGHLTVTSDSGERKNGYIVWNCLCDCGNTVQVDKRTLDRGTMTDCGCITRVRPGQRDLTGQKFGMLTARYCIDRKDQSGSYYWHCTCDCGGEVDVSLHQLQAGYRKSCGCLSHRRMEDLTGQRFGRLTVKAYAGKQNGFHLWTCVCDCGKETVVRQTLLLTGRSKSCGCFRSDVMRENLKLVDGTSVTRLQRNGNRPSRSNTSGFTGVYQNKKSGKWIAEIIFQGKMYYLGCYEKKDDAVKARQRGEEMHLDFLNRYFEQRQKENSTSI